MNHQWSPNLVVAWTLWVVGAAIIVGDLFCPTSDDFGHVGIALFVAGAIFNNRELVRSIKIREQAAYELGRDTASDVRSIR